MDPEAAYQSPDNRDGDLLATGIVMSVMAISAVILRMGCKRHLKLPVTADDYMIFFSLVSHPNSAKPLYRILTSFQLLALGLCAMLILCQSPHNISTDRTNAIFSKAHTSAPADTY